VAGEAQEPGVTPAEATSLPPEQVEEGQAPEAAPESGESSGLAEVIEPPPEASALEAYHQRARLAEDRLAEVLAAYRGLKKENEAHRERMGRNLERRYEQRRERLLLKFIDILDNMDRALAAAETTFAGEPLIEGLILVRTQLLQTLKEEGLERIPVLGLPYDPHVSEAVATATVDEPDHHGVVVKEHLRGYKLNGRVARASRVTVGDYPEATDRSAVPAAGEAAREAAAMAPALGGAEDADAVEAALPPAPASPPDSSPAASGSEGAEPSLEEIIARAEAQEALFPDAFQRKDKEGEGEENS
jgi:molecular chaperone GrpE